MFQNFAKVLRYFANNITVVLMTGKCPDIMDGQCNVCSIGTGNHKF